MKKIVVILSFCIWFAACSSPYKITKESKAAPNFKTYHTIFIGWIDFDGSRWEELGFQNREVWESCFTELNVGWLQADLNERLPRKVLIFGKPENNNPTGDLAIMFKNVKVAITVFQYEHIFMDVDFYDIPGNKLLYTASLDVAGKGYGHQMYRFVGRLGFGMKNLGEFIASKFN